MARKKVTLNYIENTTARKVTYKKRVKGLIKKTQELNVLCGVDICTIVYGPYDPAPVVWPSGEAEIRQVLMKYKGDPAIDQSQRKLTQETFLRQSVTKSEEKLNRLKRRNRELDMENVMSDLLMGKPIEQAPTGDVGDLIWVIDDKLRSIQHRIRNMEGPDNNVNFAANPSSSPNLNFINPFENEMLRGTSAVMGGNTSLPFEMQAGSSQPSHYQHQP